MLEKADQGLMPYINKYKDERKRKRKLAETQIQLATLLIEREDFFKENPAFRKKPGHPNGYKNIYYDSFGNSWTQREIDRKRSEAYRIAYADHSNPICKGCEERKAQGSAHSIPQAYAKKHRLTETIWDLEGFWPACHVCNSKAENPKGDWETLKNSQQMLTYIEKKAPELYLKFLNKI